MGQEELEIEKVIEDTLKSLIKTIPLQCKEITENRKLFKVIDPQEFTFGYMMGQTMATVTSIFTIMSAKEPSEKERLGIRNYVFKQIPEISAQVFEYSDRIAKKELEEITKKYDNKFEPKKEKIVAKPVKTF